MRTIFSKISENYITYYFNENSLQVFQNNEVFLSFLSLDIIIEVPKEILECLIDNPSSVKVYVHN